MPAYITITARLARDPELRETPHGKSLCKLSLPNDSGWGDSKLTTWWYLKKGSWVTVTGVPSLRKYEKRDGSEGTSLEVEVNDWGFCGPKPEQSQGNGNGFARQTYNNDAPSPDVPF